MIAFSKLLRVLLCTLSLVIIIIISPFVTVRIGKVKERALGNLCIDFDTSTYLISLEKNKKLQFDLWFLEGPIPSNTYLVELINNQVKIIPKIFISDLRNLFLKHSIFKRHLIPFYDTNTGLVYPSKIKPNEKFWFSYVNSPGLEKILPDLSREYIELSNSLRLIPGRKYGLHLRDSEYKKFQSQQRGMSKLQADYYAHRSMFRDSDITNFMESVKKLELLNYQGIRFGSKIKSYSNEFLKPLVNYAESQFQSPKNDIVLLKEVDFLICGFSGLTELGRWLRKPIFLLDIGEFQIFSRRLEIISNVKVILPKVIRDKITGTLLSINEIKKLKIIGMSSSEFLKFMNHRNCPINLESNTSQVISKSILLAENLLTEKTLDEDINIGKEAFQKLYGSSNFELSPVLSPFWPNLFYSN